MRGGCALRRALDNMLGGMALVVEAGSATAARIDEYRFGRVSHNNRHHTARRCLVEVDRMGFDRLAFKLAERVGFTAPRVST